MIWAAMLLMASVPHDCTVTATGVAEAFFSDHKTVCGKPLTKGESYGLGGAGVYATVYALHVEERAYELRVRYGWDGKQEVDEISIKLVQK